MAHINVYRNTDGINENSVEIDNPYKDRVYLTSDYSICMLMNEKRIAFVKADGTLAKEPSSKKSHWRDMLHILIIHNGFSVDSVDIYDGIFGEDVDTCDIDVDEEVRKYRKELGRQDFYKMAVLKGFSIKKTDNGYSLSLPIQPSEDFLVLPRILTNTIIPDANEKNYIHREEFVDEILCSLENGEKCIDICGFGGLGKTSVARLVYSKIKNTEKYDYFGYINYQTNLKNSILMSMPFYEGENPEVRWKKISLFLKNDFSKKILFIDNVDKNARLSQNPENDDDLTDISGWPNLTLVLTSRMDNIYGYTSHKIETLGNDGDIMPCVDLFNLYNKQFLNEIEIIKKIVKLCNYHTYAIEIMAKSSLTSQSLKEFYQNLRSQGYSFPKRKIKTGYSDYNENAAFLLKKLFDITTRNEKDIKILIHFALLPDMEKVTTQELKEWFEIDENDVSSLISEGWVKCENGMFFVHPLVKESILLNYDQEKVSENYAYTVIQKIKNSIFWREEESYYSSVRKIEICQSILEHINMNDIKEKADISLIVADEARKLSNRFIALQMYISAESNYRTIENELSETEKEKYWKAKYYRGYVLSYTSNNFDEAEIYLCEALNIAEELYKLNPSRKNLEHLGTSWDHYGYVLSNSERDDKAEECLRKAYDIRNKLENDYPSEYIQKVAWTGDNLGFLLIFNDEKRNEGEQLLRKALQIRKELALGQPSSEVSWTSSNLACLYLLGGYNYDEAQRLMKDALFICDELVAYGKGTHYADKAYIDNNYAILMIKGYNQFEEAKHLLMEAKKWYMQLEEEVPGSYNCELAMVYNNLANVFQYDDNSISHINEIEFLYQEALRIVKQKESIQKKEKYLEILYADICYNYWVFQKENELNPDNRRKYRIETCKVWKTIIDCSEDNIKSFLLKANTSDIEEKTGDRYPLIYYVQGGARKKRIWGNEI